MDGILVLPEQVAFWSGCLNASTLQRADPLELTAITNERTALQAAHTARTSCLVSAKVSEYNHAVKTANIKQEAITSGKTVAEQHRLPLQVHSALKRAHRPREQ